MSLINRDEKYRVRLDSLSLDIPWYQRRLDESHIELLFQSFMVDIKKGFIPSVPEITIAKYPITISGISTIKYYIIDGQHRYQTCMRLYLIGYIFEVDIKVTNYLCESEAFEKYQLYNTNKILHSQTELLNPDLMTELDRSLQTYIYTDSVMSSRFSTVNNVQRPKIKFQKFWDKYMKSSIRKSITSVQIFVDYLNSKNEEIYNWIYSPLSIRAQLDISDNQLMKAMKMNFHLGLDKELRWLI